MEKISPHTESQTFYEAAFQNYFRYKRYIDVHKEWIMWNLT